MFIIQDLPSCSMHKLLSTLEVSFQSRGPKVQVYFAKQAKAFSLPNPQSRRRQSAVLRGSRWSPCNIHNQGIVPHCFLGKQAGNKLVITPIYGKCLPVQSRAPVWFRTSSTQRFPHVPIDPHLNSLILAPLSCHLPLSFFKPTFDLQTRSP
jgi:hypothetical protein